MWRERILTMCPAAEFGAPSSAAELAATEAAVGAALPLALRELLLECDGVHGNYGLGVIWSAARIRGDNLHFRTNADFRTLYMPFDSLLFFADAGNGDQFAFPVVGGAVRDDVFVWNHENDSRSRAAPSLQLYVEWWLTGRLKI
jgi:hypothetical protein